MLVSETMAMKVMVAGDVEGSLTTLFKRVEAVDKKAGKCFSSGPLLKSVFSPGPDPVLKPGLQVLSRCFCVLAPFLDPATPGGRTIKVEGKIWLLVFLPKILLSVQGQGPPSSLHPGTKCSS